MHVFRVAVLMWSDGVIGARPVRIGRATADA